MIISLKEMIGDKPINDISTTNFKAHYLTMFFNFIRQNFENIPSEIVKDTLKQL